MVFAAKQAYFADEKMELPRRDCAGLTISAGAWQRGTGTSKTHWLRDQPAATSPGFGDINH